MAMHAIDSPPPSSRPILRSLATPGAETWEAFKTVAHSRRSVRAFDESVSALPGKEIHECIDMALLAPSTSNLQPWQFVRVVTPAMKSRMADLCFQQPAAVTAAEFIVCIGRTDRWREFKDRMLRRFEDIGFQFPKPFDRYYDRDVPIMYAVGFLGILGFLKRLLLGAVGLFKKLPPVPCSPADMKLWALKNTAFATQNLMLALAARGFASCPMDGCDKVGIRKTLGLPRGAHVLLVLGVGKPSPEDQIWGPRIRFERELFVSEV